MIFSPSPRPLRALRPFRPLSDCRRTIGARAGLRGARQRVRPPAPRGLKH